MIDQSIYNKLIKENSPKKNTKKAIFFDNLDFVIKLLQTDYSFKKQAEIYRKEIDQISPSSYQNFCKLFLQKEYKTAIKNKIFNAAFHHIAMYLSSTQILKKRTSKLYLQLKKSGALKLSKNKKDSHLSYEDFQSLLKTKLEEHGFKKIIEYDSLSPESQTQAPTPLSSEMPSAGQAGQKEKSDIPAVFAKAQTNSKTYKEDSRPQDKEKPKPKPQKAKRVKIEHDDGTVTEHHIEWLKTYYGQDRRSKIRNNITEKSFFYLQKKADGYVIDVEKARDALIEQKAIPNYSLFVYKPDDLTRIYRVVDDELYLLEEGYFTLIIDIQDKVVEAREKTIELIKEYAPETLSKNT